MIAKLMFLGGSPVCFGLFIGMLDPSLLVRFVCVMSCCCLSFTVGLYGWFAHCCPGWFRVG